MRNLKSLIKAGIFTALCALFTSIASGEITGVVTTPAGSNGNVQFNKKNAFGSDSSLTYSTTTKTLTVSTVTLGNKIIFPDGSYQTVGATVSLTAANGVLTTSSASLSYLGISSGTLDSLSKSSASLSYMGISSAPALSATAVTYSSATLSYLAISSGVTSGSTTTWTGFQTFSGSSSIKGTLATSSATAGYVGELLQAYVAPYGNVGASNAYKSLTSINFTPGDWDVSAQIVVAKNTGVFTSTNFEIGVGPNNNAANGTSGLSKLFFDAVVPTTFNFFTFTIPAFQMTFNSNTTEYLTLYVDTYSSGQPQYTCIFRARRMR